ncbi:M48 family metallopeptidase [Thiomicrorhabdus sp. ZW0627]|uniref:M48 family metallopeptidase n=1 Tax=Thiomicrorhabdus sp. ZW0627 TaxID=3039774 RepID=UPI00243647DF|nr:M48 family metallopeptidase [Thiomicrorhabdus sp. ZW0627]MDG6773972.1 M48 family metallopeptidase [Thiomicrorhabdus sp. ZW0627]
MNFYASQDRARKSTRWLVIVYLLSLTALTVISSWVLLILLRTLGFQSFPRGVEFYTLTENDIWLFAGVAGFILFGALISSYVKGRELSKGGRMVALSLGGRKIQPNTSDFNERKILNVVEEMAIASGMPVPEVYILPDESAINAFAAGLTPTDAIIGLTQGAIEKLSRAQLQGVVGHEFSHILNGDMRLNIRLIMLITGIEFVGIIGRIFTQSSRSSRRSYSSRRRSNGKGAGAIILAGIVLRLIGWIGVLFGRIIQAAVSRQREYLADASAVQFTRNPSAVANALKVIGGEAYGSKLRKTDTSQVNHLFFCQVFDSYFNFIFATHPPLEERIRHLEPSWDGEYLLPPAPKKTEEEKTAETTAESRLETVVTAAVLDGVVASQADSGVTNESVPQSLSEYDRLLEKIQEPNEAVALVVALLLRPTKSAETFSEEGAVNVLDASGFEGLGASVVEISVLLQKIGLQDELPLVEMAMPSLKSLSEPQYVRFKQLLDGIIQLDHQADIYEQTLYKLVTHFLDVHFGFSKARKVRYRKISAVAIEVQLLMSMLAHYGHAATEEAQVEQAYRKGMGVVGLSFERRARVDAYSANDFDRATEKLAHCSLELKNTIMQGLLACAQFDGKVADVERELILAIAATMDAPIPRIRL